MLIASDFHDYYDVMMKHGVDKSIVYNRRKVELKDDQRNEQLDALKKRIKEFSPWSTVEGRLQDWTLFIVGFCGNLYPGFHLEYRPPYKGVVQPSEKYFAYTGEEFSEFLRKHDKELYLKFKTPTGKKSSSWLRDRMDFTRGDVERTISDLSIHNDQLFQEIGAPVFLVWSSTDYWHSDRIIHPSLKEVQFQRIKPPHIAYQELAMFISGVLGVGSSKTVEISDVDMAAKKGFDTKASFRTDPGTRKPRWLKRQLRDK